MALEEYPNRIADAFNNKTVLITGGTGFLGKVFLEKLLRTCTEIKKIFLFIRTKKDKTPKNRLKELFNEPLYNTLKQTSGDDIFKKVEVISADIEAPDLSLSLEDKTKIIEETEMIYHCAATTRFDENFQKAVFMNTRGTKLMLKLAKECKNLKVFAHLSTAYCHLNEKVLYEKAYDPPADPHHVINACEWIKKDTLEKNRKLLLGNIPNIYVFTKALSESLVVDEMDKVPAIILRPSVIVPIWKEPIPGWTNNLNGPVGLLVGGGKGVIRTMYGNGECYCDYVPVDIIANCILTTTFFFLQTNKRFYNLTSSKDVKLSFDDMINIGKHVVANKIPFNGILWYPGGSVKKHRWHHNLEFVLFQLLPAVFVDVLLRILGYGPVLMKVQKRVLKGYELLEYFANNQWNFDNEESTKMLQMLNPRERNTYKLDSEGLNFEEYFAHCVHAARLYILKEGDETIPAAKRNMKIMYVVDKICKSLLLIGLLYLIYKYWTAKREFL